MDSRLKIIRVLVSLYSVKAFMYNSLGLKGRCNMIAYLDNSSTTKPYHEVIEVMVEAMQNQYGNPSALHKMGIAAENEIKFTKKQILKQLSSPDGEVIFTSGGTESNNLAILGTARRTAKRLNHIITSKTEHKSVLEACKALEDEGFNITWIDVDKQGYVDVKRVIEAITPQTALISLMLVNNETGIVQPVEQLAKHLKQLKTPPVLHVDAVQGFGKMRIDVKRLGADLLTISGHKIGGPKGIGALYIRKGLHLKPIIYGGGQQLDIRPGTENTYGIVGLGKAVEITFNHLEADCKRISDLRDALRQQIEASLPEIVINTPVDQVTAPHILHISFPDIRGEVLLHELESRGVFVSIGSSCNSKSKKYSHVLEAMKLTTSLKEGAVRFSLGAFTTEEEIEYAAKTVIEAYQSLRAIIKGR